MEAYHFSIRKHLFDYDSVVDKQRQKMYARRNELLDILDQVEKDQSIHDTDSVRHTDTLPIIESIYDLIPGVVRGFVTEHEQLSTPSAELQSIVAKEF
jgi:hypothetical protein